MKILLLTQGSQGVMSLRNLFAMGVCHSNVLVRICAGVENAPLVSFLEYIRIPYEIVDNKYDLDKSLCYENLKDHIMLSVSWRYKISINLINSVKLAINLHPGLLPEYRGCYSTPWSIINGEQFCGYTFHLISKDYDTGDIVLKKSFEITEYDTAFNLNYKIMNDAINSLPLAISNGLDGKTFPQKEGGKYYKKQFPYDGIIPKNADPILRNRIIRATYFPPHQPAQEEKDN